MPRRPKFIHPLRAVREALNKSQVQFATMFGISESYVQLIELGKRSLPDWLADTIMLRFGVNAESLKRKRGSPVHLIGSGKHRIELWRGGRHVSQRAEAKKAFEEFAALTRPRTIPRGTGWRSWSRLPPPIIDKRERLRRTMMFWQWIVVSAWKSDPGVMNALNNKLGLLFEAAEREHKFYAVAMWLSRWIDDAVREYRLRTTIDVIRNSRRSDAAEWTSFMETLAESFRLTPPRRRRKR